ncbi:DNA packaging tegument protein UL17 [Saimiriine alphaherpesvirus 1]|uniref:DNA packaging tegument protein UL17 n=1 Tax=Saimiriine herpesvirus 1 (strain MV-5-4-PSL) TaxID=10353 RepID=E2IUF4_SHV1|nr:DNA packaging tegument protein UL17 [Saimiriine alphaherpesvirus 1]ADO13812.1 DNA packaging tegument protein UL17 [Saimiriine alphaherpesvirus 1]
MNAHLANEVRHDMRRGSAAPHAVLLHVIVSDGCLLAAGVKPASLMAPAPCRAAGVTGLPLGTAGGGEPYGNAAPGPRGGLEGAPQGDLRRFEALVQTRRHASGACSPWSPAFAAYVPRSAVASVLAPVIPDHPGAIPSVPDGGGLFVSLPIECDEDGLYDPYGIAALRLAWGPDEDHARTLLFTYDELVPRATRYSADSVRMARLCRHFCRYVASLGRAAPAAAAAAADHLGAALAGTQESAPSHPEPPICPEEQLTAGGVDETTDAEPSLSQENEEILALVQRAVRDVARRLPVRPEAGSGASTSSRRVASGLKQGALGCGRSSDPGPSAVDETAVLAGLEPPGHGRFGVATREPHLALEDVLTLAPGQKKPRSPVEWLDAGWTALAGGDRVQWLWSRRPVSVVVRHHYGTRARFVVVSYDNSTAWGGRRAHGPALSSRMADAITEACAREQVTHPLRLSPRALESLVERFPRLGDIVSNPRPVLPPFDVTSEVAFAHRVHAACIRALGSAVRAALQGHQRVPQRLRYEFGPHQVEWLAEVTRRFPILLEHALRAVDETPPSEFFGTAYAVALINYLSEHHMPGRRPARVGPLSPQTLSAGGFGDDGTPWGAVYVFDYYSTGGETRRLSRRPIPVAIDGDVSRGQGTARFPTGSEGRSGARVCERYLPGESYAYMCVGFNRALHAVFVFPGGFAFVANVAAYLTFPPGATEALMGRFSRDVTDGDGRRGRS